MKCKVYYVFLMVWSSVLFSCSNKNDVSQEIIEVSTNTPILNSSIIKEFTAKNSARILNSIIVFTPSNGESTRTNEWGTEAIVEDNIVTHLGGNNSKIPKNGFVISGNEDGCNWINKNIYIGMQVKINNGYINCITNENTILNYANYFIERGNKRIGSKKLTSKQKEYKNCIAQILEEFKNNRGNVNVVENSCNNILKLAKLYSYTTFDSKDDIKGVWIRLRDKTPAELKLTVKKIAEIGFNAVLPETIYNGHVIYPSSNSSLPQMDKYKGWDPLRLLIQECKKYDIKVIPWCEMFFVGSHNIPVFETHPEWKGMFKNGLDHSLIEENFKYMCPSRLEVHKMLLNELEYIAKNYEINGIQLDYIRYPQSVPIDKGFCYCDYCQKLVKNRYGFDIRKISPNDKEEWAEWNKFRIDNVTRFVKNANSVIKSINPGIVISADVVPDSKKSLEYKFQDWASWVKEKYLNDVYIMTYTNSKERVSEDCEILRQNTEGTNTQPIVGLGAYMKMSGFELLEQIEIARNSGAKGVCCFAFNSMTEEQFDALRVGCFSEKNKK
ncbi:hypothetical protein DMA11_15005 [Marinilabiliaceae bacterium JC017]|nr:hypothetical protein DMA11_15005 [Marinilabiliaceae bacterium JC017]